VLKLVGVEDGPDRLDQAVGDIEGKDVDDPVLSVIGDRAGLAVDPARLDPGTHLRTAAGQPEHEPGHLLPPVKWPGRGPRLAAAIADHGHVGREHLEQGVHVTALGGGEESPGHLLALRPGGIEARLAVVHVAPGACEDLPAVRLGLAGDLGDLPVVVAEHLMQQEHGALSWRKALEQDKECHGQGIGHLRALRRIRFGARDQGFGQPGPHVRLPPHPSRLQVRNGQPGGGRGQVGLG
jgi:hypothetical protein